MDFTTFSICICLIWAGALITSRIDWKRETVDLRGLVSKLFHFVVHFKFRRAHK